MKGAKAAESDGPGVNPGQKHLTTVKTKWSLLPTEPQFPLIYIN